MTPATDMAEPIEAIEPEELREGAKRLLADRIDRRAGWHERPRADISALLGEISELGWVLLTAPPANGGLGQSFAALAPIYEEMGRALSPLSLAATLQAVDVLAATGGAAASALLDRITGGEARVATLWATVPAETPIDADFITVPGTADATDLLILPEDGEGPVLLVDLSVDGVTVMPVDTWDRTRSFCDIRLRGVDAVSLTGAGAARLARAHGDLAMAWDCIGAGLQCLDEAIAYMGTRKQFNRPIGSFQALKHRSADLKVGLEIARALADHATITFARRGAGWADLAGQARILAVDAFRAVAEESVQFHGGIGFTWEYDCHLFLKRALMNEMIDETPEQVRDRIAPAVMERALARL
ncbi:acyl-CoA dehydrogenase family protein [Sphingomonas profundi]|uniref:acyl-CoA dehydrogenase family protein n=1 Tax=Alterirhizorhabdus profundi TaxID=2681549 RepID=UPI0012E7593C|nr:acyl-CoA dehydrogenase family protein [Sphingomonas profundi]